MIFSHQVRFPHTHFVMSKIRLAVVAIVFWHLVVLIIVDLLKLHIVDDGQCAVPSMLKLRSMETETKLPKTNVK